MDWNKKCRLCLTDNPQRPVHALLCPELWIMLKNFCGIEIAGDDKMDLVCSACMHIISSLKFFKSNQLVIKECRDFQTNMFVLKKEKEDTDNDCFIVEDDEATTAEKNRELSIRNTVKRKRSPKDSIDSIKQNLEVDKAPVKRTRRSWNLQTETVKQKNDVSMNDVKSSVINASEMEKIKKCKVVLTRIKLHSVERINNVSSVENSTDSDEKLIAENAAIGDTNDDEPHMVVKKPCKTYCRKPSAALEIKNKPNVHSIPKNQNNQQTIVSSDKNEKQTIEITAKDNNNKVEESLKLIKTIQVSNEKMENHTSITAKEDNNKADDVLIITKSTQVELVGNNEKETSCNALRTFRRKSLIAKKTDKNPLINTKNVQETTNGSLEKDKLTSTTAKETKIMVKDPLMISKSTQDKTVANKKEKSNSSIAIVSPEVCDTEITSTKSQFNDSKPTPSIQPNLSKTVAWIPMKFNMLPSSNETPIKSPTSLTITPISTSNTSQPVNTRSPQCNSKILNSILSRSARQTFADAAVAASTAMTSKRADNLLITQTNSNNDSFQLPTSSRYSYEQKPSVTVVPKHNIGTNQLGSTINKTTSRAILPKIVSSKFFPHRVQSENIHKVKVLTVNELNTKHNVQTAIVKEPKSPQPNPVVGVVNPNNTNPTAELTVRFIRRNSTFYITILLYGRTITYADLNPQQSQYLCGILSKNLKRNIDTQRLLSKCRPDEATLDMLKHFKIDHLLNDFL